MPSLLRWLSLTTTIWCLLLGDLCILLLFHSARRMSLSYPLALPFLRNVLCCVLSFSACRQDSHYSTPNGYTVIDLQVAFSAPFAVCSFMAPPVNLRMDSLENEGTPSSDTHTYNPGLYRAGKFQSLFSRPPPDWQDSNLVNGRGQSLPTLSDSRNCSRMYGLEEVCSGIFQSLISTTAWDILSKLSTITWNITPDTS